MADLDVLLDCPGAEYKLAKAFSCEFKCKVSSDSHLSDPGDGLGPRERVKVDLNWFAGSDRVAHGWFIVDAAEPSVIHFQGLYVDEEHQNKGIFTSVVSALDLWAEIGIKEGRVGGTPTSAPTFQRYGFDLCERPIMAGGEPLAIYAKPTCNKQDELEP